MAKPLPRRTQSSQTDAFQGADCVLIFGETKATPLIDFTPSCSVPRDATPKKIARKNRKRNARRRR